MRFFIEIRTPVASSFTNGPASTDVNVFLTGVELCTEPYSTDYIYWSVYLRG